MSFTTTGNYSSDWHFSTARAQNYTFEQGNYSTAYPFNNYNIEIENIEIEKADPRTEIDNIFNAVHKHIQDHEELGLGKFEGLAVSTNHCALEKIIHCSCGVSWSIRMEICRSFSSRDAFENYIKESIDRLNSLYLYKENKLPETDKNFDNPISSLDI